MEEKEFNLWKLLEIIARRIKFIIFFILLVTVTATVISLLLPKWYQATTLVLPPKDEGLKLGWGGSIDRMTSLTSGLSLPLMATPTDVYARIVGSRALLERVADKNNLSGYYNLESRGDLYKRIEEKLDYRVTPEGLMEISFTDRNAEMAAQVTNSFAEELDALNRQLATSRARLAKEFIKDRLSTASADLESARRALQDFQDKNMAIDLDRQTQLAIESAVGLKVDLARNEIELNLKERTLSPNHPDVIILRQRVNEIKKQISNLEFGGSDSTFLNLPISEVPQLKIIYAELTTRVQIAETLFRLLSEQYEQAKIQEMMNTPTISIIDRAYPPELPIKPQKRIIVSIAFIISLVIAIFLALFFDYLENLRTKSPADYDRARYFMDVILGWLPGVKKTARTK
ncbi:MAG: Wzz/FepE/Etk N-terminal domain-containing protein [Candidatus Zixiibacteriota bacterium]